MKVIPLRAFASSSNALVNQKNKLQIPPYAVPISPQNLMVTDARKIKKFFDIARNPSSLDELTSAQVRRTRNEQDELIRHVLCVPDHVDDMHRTISNKIKLAAFKLAQQFPDIAELPPNTSIDCTRISIASALATTPFNFSDLLAMGINTFAQEDLINPALPTSYPTNAILKFDTEFGTFTGKLEKRTEIYGVTYKKGSVIQYNPYKNYIVAGTLAKTGTLSLPQNAALTLPYGATFKVSESPYGYYNHPPKVDIEVKTPLQISQDNLDHFLNYPGPLTVKGSLKGNVIFKNYQGHSVEVNVANIKKIEKNADGKITLYDYDEKPLHQIDTRKPKVEVDYNLFRLVSEIDFSTRVKSRLRTLSPNKSRQIYLFELIQQTESDLLKLPSLGKESLQEIKDFSSDMGLGLELGRLFTDEELDAYYAEIGETRPQ